MKKLAYVSMLGATLGAALALSACGGDSDSSGAQYNSTYNIKLANGNEYSCPTETAHKQCTTDSTCKAATCKLTKKVVEPFYPDSTKNCEVIGTTIYGIRGETCKVSLSILNGGKPVPVICLNNGALILNGNTSGSGTTNLNNYTFTCKK